MDLQLQGRTAFVSGSTQGIGFAIAAALAEEGVRVTLNGRTEERVQEAVASLQAAHPDGGHDGVVADLAQREDVERLLDAVEDVDILVSNVGLFGVKEFGSITDEDWEEYFALNVMSGVRLSRRILPRLLDRGWGRMVFIGSESGVNIPADMVHYGATKAATLALANGLAKLTRGTEVTVNTVLGGPTYSDGVAAAVDAIAGAADAPVEIVKEQIIGQNTTSLLERFLEPSEIAHLVAYLASPRASATNGAAIRADGGVLTSML